MSQGPVVLSVRGWDRYDWLRHAFSSRLGGVSTVYGGGLSGEVSELNLGWTTEDDPAAVMENRRRFAEAVGGGELITVRQVHGTTIRVVGEGDGALQGRLRTGEGKAVLEGDGLITRIPGVLLGIQTADCVPVLLVDVEKRAVGAFHAGWRGTAARIVEHGVAAMAHEFGTRPKDLVAAVGPSIGACCYVVGKEVRDSFENGFEYAADLFRDSDGETRLDLWEANRRQLVAAGVEASHIVITGECSGCAVGESGRKRYFSHRVDKGVTGRMMSVVGIAGSAPE